MDTSLNPFARTSAREAVIAKRDEILALRSELLDQRGEILVRLRSIDRELSDCRAAARLFELDVEFPEDDERMQFARREMAMAAEYEARYRQRRLLEDAAARSAVRVQDAISATVVPAPTLAAAPGKRPPIRDIVLEQLKLASPEGRKAADIRNYIEKTFGEMIHEKTVGMTLYRLSQQGLVRRDGHVWFYGSASAEGENPGKEPGFDL